MPIPSLDQSDQEVNVKVFEEDREVEFPVRKITVTSKHAKEIVCALKPNNEKLSKSVVWIGNDNVDEYAKNVRLQNTNR